MDEDNTLLLYYIFIISAIGHPAKIIIIKKIVYSLMLRSAEFWKDNIGDIQLEIGKNGEMY